MSFRNTFIVAIVLSVLGQISTAATCAEIFLPEVSHHRSQSPLSKQRFVTKYSEFKFQWLPEKRGFIFSSKTEGPARMKRFIVSPPLEKEGPWHSEIWSIGPDFFRFLDVGYKRFEFESKKIDQLINDHMANFPDKDLHIEYHPTYVEMRDRIQTVRWKLHDAVLEHYRMTKKELTEEDIITLEVLNRKSGHSDVFGIENPSTSGSMLALQISYYGDRDFFQPTLRGLLLTAGYSIYEGKDMLPFEYRISKFRLEKFREQFYARFAPTATAEFTRYARFVELPRPVHDRFLLNALLTAKERGVKTIVAGGNMKTGRLFRMYGFKFYSELPIGSSAVPNRTKESLWYLEVESAEFNTLISRLRNDSQYVDTAVEVIQKPMSAP